MTTAVRQATVCDVEAIQEVARKSWHAAYDGFLGQETVETIIDDWYDIDGLEESISTAVERSDVVFLVAEAGGGGSESQNEPTGFVHVVPSSEDPTVASLIRIYVRPGKWGSGVGTTLRERAEETLENQYERLRLGVFAENSVGVSFYESSGFEHVDEHEAEFAGDTQTVYTYEKSFALE